MVEDGEASAEKMIVEEFSDLNIRYYSTGERKTDVQKREILHYRKQPGNILIFWTMMISFCGSCRNPGTGFGAEQKISCSICIWI